MRNYIIFYIIYNKKSMHLNDRMISVFISFLILLLKKNRFLCLEIIDIIKERTLATSALTSKISCQSLDSGLGLFRSIQSFWRWPKRRTCSLRQGRQSVHLQLGSPLINRYDNVRCNQVEILIWWLVWRIPQISMTENPLPAFIPPPLPNPSPDP